MYSYNWMRDRRGGKKGGGTSEMSFLCDGILVPEGSVVVWAGDPQGTGPGSRPSRSQGSALRSPALPFCEGERRQTYILWKWEKK